MAHPKHRKSHSRSGMKKAHHAVKVKSFSKCPNCFEVKMPHRVCPNCGYYKDNFVYGE